MKKFLLILSVFLLVNPVMAKSVKVEAMSDFTTENPKSNWQVKVLEGFVADNGIVVHPNTVIEGKIVDVTSPKRLKRAASFTFVPQRFYDPTEGVTKNVKRDFEGKYSKKTEMTAKNVAKKGALTAGNILIGSFVSPAVGLVEGAVKNEDGNRAKSAVKSAYENTPLSYASKGKDLEFKKGQVFIMNFKLKGEEDTEENLPNYTYEVTNQQY